MLAGGIGALGTYFGARTAANASKYATDAQTKLAEEAKEYEKQRDTYHAQTEGNRYAAMMAGEQPYIDTGAAADKRLAQMFGWDAPAPMRHTEPPPQYGVPSMGSMTSPLPTDANDPRMKIPGFNPHTGIVSPSQQPGPGVPEQTVAMQSPDGSETRQVPVSQVQHYSQLGAKRV